MISPSERAVRLVGYRQRQHPVARALLVCPRPLSDTPKVADSQPLPCPSLGPLVPELPAVIHQYTDMQAGEPAPGAATGVMPGAAAGVVPGGRVPMTLPTVSNMVYRVHLKVQFDMRRIYLAFGHAEYHPTKFAGAKIRHDNVTCSVYRPGKIIITSGKTVMTAKSNAHRYRLLIEQIPQPVALVKSAPRPAPGGAPRLDNFALHRMTRAEKRRQLTGFTRFGLRSLAPYTFYDSAGVVNIVADGHLGTSPLSLASIWSAYREYAMWNPAKFTGLSIPINRKFLLAHPRLACKVRSECTIIIFHTGRDNIMGASTLDDVYAVHRFFARLVREHHDPAFCANGMSISEYSIAEHQRVTKEHHRKFRKRVRRFQPQAGDADGRAASPARKRARVQAPAVALTPFEQRALAEIL